MAELPREVDIFRKYSKNNKLITYAIATGIAIVIVVALYFFIKVVLPYTVTYETFGGTEVPSVSYRFLERIREPEQKVKKEGFYIEKWSTKEDLSNTFTFGTKLWRSTKLYVDWQPGFAVVLNFAENQENEDLSTADLKLLYEQYIKPGTDWTMPAVYNLNEKSLNYGERLVWYDNPECTGDPIIEKTYTNLTENIQLYGKWFDVDAEKFSVDENGVLQRYLGYAKNIILPSNVTAIKEIVPSQFIPGTDQIHEQNAPNASAFRNVINSIEQIYLNKELQTVGSCAFRNCVSLKNIVFLGDNVTKLGQYVFTNTIIENIKLPRFISTIEAYSFYNTTNLKSITLGENVERIEESAFVNCYNLKTVELHSAPIIETRAFSSCIGMTKFIIKAETLSTISLGIDEEAIREKCLADNPSATEQDIANAIEEAIRTSNIFYNTAGTTTLTNYLKIYVPESMLAQYKSAYGWDMYADYIEKIKS